jgi:hypothetical protein
VAATRIQGAISRVIPVINMGCGGFHVYRPGGRGLSQQTPLHPLDSGLRPMNVADESCAPQVEQYRMRPTHLAVHLI